MSDVLSLGAAAPFASSLARLDAKRGVFGARMEVELVGDGRVTLMLER